MEADVKLIVNLINAAMFVICLVIMAVGWILQSNIEKSEKTILDALNMMSEDKKVTKGKGKLTIQRVIKAKHAVCRHCGCKEWIEQDVSQQRELLVAFCKYLEKEGGNGFVSPEFLADDFLGNQ